MNEEAIMKKIPTAVLAVAVSAAMAVAMAASAPAAPAGEPLATPARMSPKAPQALMLGVAQAGLRLVAVGERGIIIYSDVGGSEWTQAGVPVGVTLTAVHFPDAEHGYAAGHDGAVLSSRDGGRHWSKVLDGVAINALMLAEAKQAAESAQQALERAAPAAKEAAQAAVDRAQNALGDVEAALKFGPSRPLLAAWFRNPGTGWVVGAYGQILRTGDAGRHWESLAARVPNPEGLHFNSIGPGMDGTLLMAGEGGRVYRSADDGSSWRGYDTGYKGQLYGVLEPQPNTLLAYGFGGRVLRSADGGAHWQELPQLGGKALVGGAVLLDGSIVLAARDGALFRSSDMGRSFAVQQAGGNLEIAALAMLGQAPILAGVGGVHRAAAIEARKAGQQ